MTTFRDKLAELTAWLSERGVCPNFTITLELDAIAKLEADDFPEHTLVSMRVKTPHGWVIVRGRDAQDPLSRADD